MSIQSLGEPFIYAILNAYNTRTILFIITELFAFYKKSD